jgi:trimeric autotransporter adhesin
MPTPRPAKMIHRLAAVALRTVLASIAVAGLCADVPAQRVALATRTPIQSADAIDAGALPSSTPIELTVTLAMSPEQNAALDEFLANITTPASPAYHQWLTPQQFAARFGATDAQIATISAWLTSQGLSVDAVSASKTRLTISGTASTIENAFAVTLHQYRIGDNAYFANMPAASLPPEITPMIASLSGLNNMPPLAAVTGTSSGGAAVRFTPATQTPTPNPLSTIAAAIDTNATPILTIDTAACTSDFAQSDYDAYRALLRQANAQGITILATSACATASFPASLAEATAIIAPDSTPAATPQGIAIRPTWQSAPGLPVGSTRIAPDLTTPTITAFAQTLSTIIQQSGARQGNINATLYTLAAEPGLFTQPDTAATGTWEPATGLGQVDLAKLIRAWPRGITASTTSVSSSLYPVTYGQPFTLAAIVQPSGGSSPPTGTITFTAAAQGVLGTASLINGTATLPLGGTLPVGTYTIAAAYSGDATYAASTSPPSAIVTISQATGGIAANISPSTIGTGATAILLVTVTLPYPGEPPTGNVTATVNGVPGAVYTTALTSVPNTASAAATIAIPAPSNPGTYTVQITCAGSANFQCPTPGLVSLTSTSTVTPPVTGNTSTTLTSSVTNPTAGQSITLTANLVTSVTGTPTGTVIFYDNGNAIASAPIANKQASAVVSLTAGPSQMLTATYSGDATFNTSTSAPIAVNVAAVPSSMSLAESATSSLLGSNVLFTAEIRAGVAPTGIVTFYDLYNGGTTSIGTATLVPAGTALSIAQFSTAALLAGVHQVYAIYLGDTSSGGVTSSTLAVTVSDYTIAASPQSLTLTSGQTGTVTLTIGTIGNFSGNVSITCIAPANTQTTCSISQGTQVTSKTMTITTTAAQARTTTTRRGIFQPAASAAALAMLLCFCAPGRRRRLPTLLLATLALSLAAGLAMGCAGSTTLPAAPGTPAGTTIFSIDTAGTDGVTTITHDYQYPVTLN